MAFLDNILGAIMGSKTGVGGAIGGALSAQGGFAGQAIGAYKGLTDFSKPKDTGAFDWDSFSKTLSENLQKLQTSPNTLGFTPEEFEQLKKFFADFFGKLPQ